MSQDHLFDNPARCAEAIVDRVGRNIVLAIPTGIGKPNLTVNALYALAESDRSLKLRILTGLTLVRPRYKSDIERRFVAPLLDRLFATWPDLAYAEAMRKGTLAPNVTVHEFFLQAGQWLSNAVMQQSYASLGYSHVAQHVQREGANVMAQLVAPPPVPANGSSKAGYSLASNTDVALDLKDYVAGRRAAGFPMAVVGEVNSNLPYMRGEAEVTGDNFDLLLEPARPHFDLFAPPKEPVSLAEYAMALHVATLVKDGGTLQIGIGSFADALTHALILRHTQNARFRALIDRLGEPSIADAQLGPFDQGLYGCSEMLVDGFLALRRAGILKRRVAHNGGKALVHAGFFLGSRAFYDELRSLSKDELDEIVMTSIAFTNTLRGDAATKIAHRRDARFVNTALAATLLGEVSSDQLADGRVISGIGGQADFVTMAHEIPSARSIIAVRSTRSTSLGRTASNIHWRYANTSIPRYLRDVVATEYGLADIRGRTDGDVVAAMLAITDARFQSDLQHTAVAAGKLGKSFKLSSRATDNLPQRIEQALGSARREGLLPLFPLGTDMTSTEQALVPILSALRGATLFQLVRMLAKGLMPGKIAPDLQAGLERLGLERPTKTTETAMRALVLGAMRSADGN